MFANVQNLRISLHSTSIAQPTVLTEEEALSMAIAKHLRDWDGISYDARLFPHKEWKYHLANKVLFVYPNFSDECYRSGTLISNAETADDAPASKDSSAPTPTASVSTPGNSIPEPGDADSGAQSSSPKSMTVSSIGNRFKDVNSSETRPSLGRKSNIRLCQNHKLRERRIINAEFITDCLELRKWTNQKKIFLCLPTLRETKETGRKKIREPILYVCFANINCSVSESIFLTVTTGKAQRDNWMLSKIIEMRICHRIFKTFKYNRNKISNLKLTKTSTPMNKYQWEDRRSFLKMKLIHKILNYILPCSIQK